MSITEIFCMCNFEMIVLGGGIGKRNLEKVARHSRMSPAKIISGSYSSSPFPFIVSSTS